MSSIRAFIDLGTNTFHLLIAEINEGNSNVIFRTKKLVGLGAGGINDNKITPDAMQRGIDCLIEFEQHCTTYKVGKINAYGTSALRNAFNSPEFINSVLEKTGITIQVIDGDKEAELIQLGISTGITFLNGPYLIMDIGGGSTEFIIVENDEIKWKRSFEVGVQRLVSKYLTSDPISSDSYKAMNIYHAEFLRDLTEINNYNPIALVGASGTFTTLERMYKEVQEEGFNENTYVPRSFFDTIFSDLIVLPREERIKMPGISPPRVDLIVVGASIVNHVLKTLDFNGFYVSDGGLKEGAMVLAEKGKL